ncbi:hypothetical protein DL89DRAFT_93249 [Linderina pennispora]|uniref:Uncharacterized protein n=1 Tax=Linderina pennispora TaxID=61395 RepID=A0A1Y1VX34_9FUNG|nr:uncharacterized protein DL89DRAFT_93249 [Linderina pennispora]ORX65877.1 hypothetical protein DL89DRAFT_93249 [Linderina pennispora]
MVASLCVRCFARWPREQKPALAVCVLCRWSFCRKGPCAWEQKSQSGGRKRETRPRRKTQGLWPAINRPGASAGWLSLCVRLLETRLFLPPTRFCTAAV